MNGRFWPLLVIACALLMACAGRHRARDARVAAALERSGDDAQTRAAAARYRSARARADAETGHESMELRMRGFSADNFDNGGRGITTSLRIPMENPWAVARSREARDEMAAAMASSVESAAVVATAESCALGATRAVGEAAAQRQSAYREQMATLRAWAEGWASSETLSPLEGAELLLEMDRRLASLETPVDGLDAQQAATMLPPLEARPPLDDSPETLRARLSAAHPEVERHAAAARSYRALARRERARAAPWFGFVEVGFETGEGAGAVETRFAIELPLAARPRVEARRQNALAEAEEHEMDALVNELARDALRALRVLSDFFARGAALAQLEERATAAEELALRYLNQRAGHPRSVARLLNEVLDARLTILDAQRKAAMAACDLYMATGIVAAEWPTRP